MISKSSSPFSLIIISPSNCRPLSKSRLLRGLPSTIILGCLVSKLPRPFKFFSNFFKIIRLLPFPSICKRGSFSSTSFPLIVTLLPSTTTVIFTSTSVFTFAFLSPLMVTVTLVESLDEFFVPSFFAFFLLIISITPSAAFSPYFFVAMAPFNTLTLSISEGAISLILVTIFPSNIYKGVLPSLLMITAGAFSFGFFFVIITSPVCANAK